MEEYIQYIKEHCYLIPCSTHFGCGTRCQMCTKGICLDTDFFGNVLYTCSIGNVPRECKYHFAHKKFFMKEAHGFDFTFDEEDLKYLYNKGEVKDGTIN